MEELLREKIAEVARAFGGDNVEVELSYPDEKYGDFASNIALKLAASNDGDPRQIAADMTISLKQMLGDRIDSIEVAGPGFINFVLSDKALLEQMVAEPDQPLKGQIIVAEYSDPNPFKILHAGHLYTSIVGDVISNLLAAAGAEVYRVNYGGDVGLHVAKSIWAILKELDGEYPESLDNIPPMERGAWMSQMYVRGNSAFDEGVEEVVKEITDINARVYDIQNGDDHDSPLAKIYWMTRNWSYVSFDQFYSRLNIFFDRYYPESETAPIGLKIVQEQLDKGVFERSDGAIVFRGEKYGLHTRVFVNSKGLPTYEAKELGLAQVKQRDFNYNRSLVITGNEQKHYMEVVYKALEQFNPEIVKNTSHLTHGMVRLSGGKKMSSRLGNIITAEDVLIAAGEAASEVNDNNDDRVVLAAVKYSFLKQAMGADIVYDPKESVNILGNSGPYLQYAHARACSIMTKSGKEGYIGDIGRLTDGERKLVLKMSRLNATIEQASRELAPHILCSYLYELCQIFNQFYESNRVIGDDRERFRLHLVSMYADKLKSGLKLLGITAPDKL